MPIRTVEYRAFPGGTEAIHRTWTNGEKPVFPQVASFLNTDIKELSRLIPTDPLKYRIDQRLSDEEILTAAAALRRAEIERVNEAQARAKKERQPFERPEIAIGMQPDLRRDGIIVTVRTPLGVNEAALDIPFDNALAILENYKPRAKVSSQPPA